MLMSNQQRAQLIADQPKTKQRRMGKWIVKNDLNIDQTWEAMLEMDDRTFAAFRRMVDAVATIGLNQASKGEI